MKGIAEALRVLWAALKKFDADRGLFLASGIAFSVLLSLIPLLLLVLSLFGTYLSSDAEVLDHISESIRGLVPALDPKITANLLGIARDRHAIGVIGIAGLLWTSSMVFTSLRASLNIVLDVERGRNALHGMAVDLLLVLVSGAMVIGSMALTSWVSILQRYESRLPADFGPALELLLKYLVPLVLTVVMCFLVYKIAPCRRTAAVPALKAAIFTGLLWEAAKQLFSWYVLHLGTFSLVYGSLSTVAVFFLWIYYSAIIFLVGGELVAELEHRAASA